MYEPDERGQEQELLTVYLAQERFPGHCHFRHREVVKAIGALFDGTSKKWCAKSHDMIVKLCATGVWQPDVDVPSSTVVRFVDDAKREREKARAEVRAAEQAEKDAAAKADAERKKKKWKSRDNFKKPTNKDAYDPRMVSWCKSSFAEKRAREAEAAEAAEKAQRDARRREERKHEREMAEKEAGWAGVHDSDNEPPWSCFRQKIAEERRYLEHALYDPVVFHEVSCPLCCVFVSDQFLDCLCTGEEQREWAFCSRGCGRKVFARPGQLPTTCECAMKVCANYA